MQIGEFQRLKVIGESDHGLYLGDGHTKVLLPNNQCPDDLLMNDYIEVFVYTDSEDRPIATVDKPFAKVGEFALLRCVGSTQHGGFFNWGLAKDLFCPIREQQYELMEGEDYVVRVYLDQISNRVVCSTKFKRFITSDGSDLESGQKVSIIVIDFTRDFITVVVDEKIKGLIFPDEWHETLELGEKREAYVKRIRPDDKRVAISLRPQGYEAVLGERERILDALRKNNGTLPVSDKSSPEEIHDRFGLSKGAFKKILGNLYREGLIEIGPRDIYLRTR